MWRFATPVHLHGMIYLYIGNFMYIFTFVSGKTDIVLKKEYYILKYEDVLSGRNSPTFWKNCHCHLFKMETVGSCEETSTDFCHTT